MDSDDGKQADAKSDIDSDFCDSDDQKGKQKSKTVFTERITRDLISSQDQVDKRLLRLHNISTDPQPKANDAITIH